MLQIQHGFMFCCRDAVCLMLPFYVCLIAKSPFAMPYTRLMQMVYNENTGSALL